MSKLLVANWKMNPQTEAEAIRLAKAIDKKGVVIVPPFVFLSSFKKVLKRAFLGAQDVFWQNPPAGGAYTGEISSMMLKKLGVEYVIIGHSERRALGETDEMVNKKIKAALAVGLKVVLCVGEPKGKSAKNYVKMQLQKDLKGVKIRNLLVAYEPIWAIGTGKADSPKKSAEVINFIKSLIYSKVLYGGSVNSKNSTAFLKVSDGLLVGGASLNAKEFGKIITNAHF